MSYCKKFKVNFFNCILDQIVISLEERFESLEQYNNLFRFLYIFRGMEDEKLIRHCKDFQIHLSDPCNNSDLDGVDLNQR